MVNLKSKLKQVQKQRGALLVMNLVIIALCLVLFWGTIHMFRQLNDAFSRPAKTNWMENNVQNENYAYLLVNYHEDMVYGGFAGMCQYAGPGPLSASNSPTANRPPARKRRRPEPRKRNWRYDKCTLPWRKKT